MNTTIEITDSEGRFDRFICTPEEAEGVRKYMDRHQSIPAVVCARLYLAHLRTGVDLNTLPLPQRSAEQMEALK